MGCGHRGKKRGACRNWTLVERGAKRSPVATGFLVPRTVGLDDRSMLNVHSRYAVMIDELPAKNWPAQYTSREDHIDLPTYTVTKKCIYITVVRTCVCYIISRIAV